MSALSSPVVIRKTWLSRKPRSIASLVAAWMILLLVLSSVFYWQNALQAQSWMPASGESIFERKEFFRLWTALFAHGDLGHLLSNSLSVFVLGYFMAGYFSLWFFPGAAIALGGLINLLTLFSYEPQIKLIGISGVVYWMGGAWLTLYLLLDQQRSLAQRFLRSLGVALAVFMPTSAFDPTISYLCHGYGFLVGVLSGALFYFLFRKKFLSALVVEQLLEENDENPVSNDFLNSTSSQGTIATGRSYAREDDP
ncbi:MAG: rhomboid family intramembrane serine protease [Bdellovibrio sp.]